jgi:hypothetical protein
MKKIISFLLLMSASLLATSSPKNAEKEVILAGLLNYNDPKTWLLSYPRSGNTWIRYCLEFFTERPTLASSFVDEKNEPLDWLAGLNIDFNKPPIEKTYSLVVRIIFYHFFSLF